jgi:hypothetical protein
LTGNTREGKKILPYRKKKKKADMDRFLLSILLFVIYGVYFLIYGLIRVLKGVFHHMD